MKVNKRFPYLICVFSYLSHIEERREGNLAPASPHIYTPVKQKVMDYCLKVPKHSDQLKKVECKYVTFCLFLVLPIIFFSV